MRRYLLRETVFTHFSVALGVLLLTAALIISPQGKTLASAAPPSLETSTASQVSPAAMRPDISDPIFVRDNTVETSRGSRDGERPATTAAPSAPPTPTATSLSPTAAAPGPVAAATPSAPAAAPGPSRTPFHVGIQAGHWKEAELPQELASLRGETGAVGNGWKEVDINLSVANRVAALLRQDGIVVDVLPATVPVGYKADAFLAIHGDANSNTSFSGFKMARARWSKIPQKDDALIAAVSAQYQAATGLPDDPSTITADMREYYAFNWRDLQHAVAPTTPSAILELGFLTTTSDRDLILQHQDRVASGIAKGIILFLTGR